MPRSRVFSYDYEQKKTKQRGLRIAFFILKRREKNSPLTKEKDNDKYKADES
jgi:hypothetical protein